MHNIRIYSINYGLTPVKNKTYSVNRIILGDLSGDSPSNKGAGFFGTLKLVPQRTFYF